MDNQKLSDRVMALEGPDREIFLAAYAACYPNGGTPWASDASHQARFELLVAKEAWLDAAMSLVPEGLRWCVDTCDGVPRSFVEPPHPYEGQPYWGNHVTTPAIALCAAALKARGL